MVGSIFVRSFERGERIFRAMQARGYDNELVTETSGPLRGADVTFFVFVLVSAALIRIVGGLL
jgi:cobalt/nickel transport system permease protein